MITTIIKRWNGLLAIAGFVTMATLAACNSNDNSNGTSSNSSDTVSTGAMAADTTTVKPVAKSRKGKASISMMSNGTDNSAATNVKDKDGAYGKVDVMPMYPGGETALQQFVENNVSYPQPAMDGNIEGTVKVSFVVDENGMVTKPQVIETANPGNGLDQEALRVVKQMPKWTPGTIKGKTVKTRLELPITFKLSET